MEHQSEKFTWKIENFSKLNDVLNIHSETFLLGGYSWRINLYPMGNKRDGKLSIYLEAVQMQTEDKEWSRDVKFRLVVFDQLDANRTVVKEFKNEFNANIIGWGYESFMPLGELHDPQKGFIVKDVCIIGAEVFVGKLEPTNENRVSQEAYKDLPVLWEELQKFRPDLTWLETHVQSALGVKNYVEKALHVEKLKKNVVAQELETKRLKEELAAAEQNLDMERNMLKMRHLK